MKNRTLKYFYRRRNDDWRRNAGDAAGRLAGVGFGMTLLLLGTLWALMCYTALFAA